MLSSKAALGTNRGADWRKAPSLQAAGLLRSPGCVLMAQTEFNSLSAPMSPCRAATCTFRVPYFRDSQFRVMCVSAGGVFEPRNTYSSEAFRSEAGAEHRCNPLAAQRPTLPCVWKKLY